MYNYPSTLCCTIVCLSIGSFDKSTILTWHSTSISTNQLPALSWQYIDFYDLVLVLFLLILWCRKELIVGCKYNLWMQNEALTIFTLSLDEKILWSFTYKTLSYEAVHKEFVFYYCQDMQRIFLHCILFGGIIFWLRQVESKTIWQWKFILNNKFITMWWFLQCCLYFHNQVTNLFLSMIVNYHSYWCYSITAINSFTVSYHHIYYGS